MFDKVGIIGLGYVGVPLALRIAEAGLTVLGFDIDQSRVADLNNGISPIKHIPNEDIIGAKNSGFLATTDFSKSSECDALIICVPTPLSKMREPDLSFIEATMKALKPYFRKGQLLSLESTTWPGTTTEILAPYVEKAGFTIGEDFYLAYSPEREDPGNTQYSTRTIPKVVGGATQPCLDSGVALYEIFIDKVVPVSSPEAAEMVKLLENIHRSVNIGLVNELKIVADRMDLDIYEIIDAAATKPFGFKPYYPGPGIGGHCIPIDPFYLTWKAREFGVHTKFIELAGEVNASMPDYVVTKLLHGLNRFHKPLSGAKILALGIAYKPNIDDMRESPSVFVMEKIREMGGIVEYSDPHVPNFPKMREHSFDLSSVALSASKISEYDAVILLTNHDGFDYKMIEENAKLIVDSRGVYRSQSSKIVSA